MFLTVSWLRAIQTRLASSALLSCFFSPDPGQKKNFGILEKILGFFPAPSKKGLRNFVGVVSLMLPVTFFLPRMSLGAIGFSSVDLRLEDLIILTLVLAYFSFAKRGPDSPATSSEKAILMFLFACLLSVFSGIFFKLIDKPLLSFLYLLKWVEYFLLFSVMRRLVLLSEKTDFVLGVFFVTGIVLAAYGYWEHATAGMKAVYPNYYRIFERFPFHGDANHIGGFLIFWILFWASIYSRTSSKVYAGCLLLAVLFAYYPLIWTYSRKSYLALWAGFFLLGFLQPVKRRWLLLITLLLLATFLFPTRVAERISDIQESLVDDDPFHSSWSGIWFMWQQVFWNFDHFFIFGTGLGSRHRLFYESQYILVLVETGVVGFFFFIALVMQLIRDVSFKWFDLNEKKRNVALSWTCAFAGLLLHGFTCVSFTVSKIAIPFWFVTAAVFAYLSSPSSHDARECL